MSQDKTASYQLQTRNRVITEAREWMGTPYQHQAMLKGVGSDCVGFVVGVGLATGVLTLTKQDRKAYAGYGRLPNPSQMRTVLERHCVEVPEHDVRIADVAWIEWRENLPMHLAMVGTHKGNRTLLHAVSDAGKVVEHTLTKQWDERIVSFWRYPGLT